MRLVILTSALLIAATAAAQNSSSVPADRTRAVAPPIILAQGSGDTCLTMRIMHAHRTERFPMTLPRAFPEPQSRDRVDIVPRSSTEATCTPANRFRAMYIPSPTLQRDQVPAVCPDCAVLPKDSPTPELQPVRQPQ